jgi:hypothetical protein
LAKSWADQLATVGKPIDDDDLISFIISGLNPSFNAFISTFNFATHETLLLYDDFEVESLNHETLLENQNTVASSDSNTFALYSNKQHNRDCKPKFNGPQKPNHPPKPHFSHQNQKPTTTFPKYKPNQSSPIPFNSSRPPCQICGKPNHQALDCYHWMDYSYQGRHPPTQLVAMVAHTNSQLVEEDHQPWYADSGANQHIIADLENLNLSSEPYQGNTDVDVRNGSSL